MVKVESRKSETTMRTMTRVELIAVRNKFHFM